MTLSKEDRDTNIRFTLSLLLEQLDDQYLGHAYFEISDPDFARVLPTSWCELERRGLIQERLIAKGQTHYRLTGKGYREALKNGGAYDPKLEDRLGRLCAELKRHVKGRSRAAVLFPSELATDSAFSENWIKNVLEAQLIEDCLNRRGPGLEDKGSLVVIPVDFGYELE